MPGKNPARENAAPLLSANAAGIRRAVEVLEQGGLVAVPTETVYGLAARADSEQAVAGVYTAKGRPRVNPLIVHVRDRDHAAEHGVFDDVADALAQRYWPGPLTLVLPRQDNAPLAATVTAGLPSVALRVSAHPVMQRLLDRCGFALAAPSANRSGFISPTNASHVAASLEGAVDLILDGGPTDAGIESTILAVRAGGEVEELRPGPITLEDAGRSSDPVGGAPEAPGQLASHYAPGKPVRLEAECAQPDEFLIGFGPIAGNVTLSARGDLAEAATRLYACLHEGAAAAAPRIAVAPVPSDGIGRAINDRLRRAAARPDD